MSFGGWAISEDLFNLIRDILPEGKTILELGSGEGTAELVKHYKVYSVEHSKQWLGKYKTNYLYVPLEKFRKQCNVFPEDTSWYNREILQSKLSGITYDLILIDGPPRNAGGRGGFYKWMHFFNLDVPIVFDDYNRPWDQKMVYRVSARLKRPYTVYFAWERKHVAVIYP